jgi:hypothetical protein
VLTQQTLITGATFTGLIPVGSSTSAMKNVVVEMYRVFPNDSNVNRTSGQPTFSTPNVPTRMNSPSDMALDERQFSAGSPGLAAIVLNSSFTAMNSVKPGGIHPLPNVFTGGNGSLSGQETLITVNFTTLFNLPADHYFFVPQVELSNGDFVLALRTEADRAAGNAFPPGFTDLQSWTRDASNGGIEPDWLRIGTGWSSRLGATPSADRLSGAGQDAAGALCPVPRVIKFKRVARSGSNGRNARSITNFA